MFGMVKIGGGLVGGVVVEMTLGMEELIEGAGISMEAKRR